MHQTKRFLLFFKTLILLILCNLVAAQTAPDAAQQFKLTSTQNSKELILHWTIAKDHFLYQERIHWQTEPKISKLEPLFWPKPHAHQDRLGIIHQIYEHDLELHFPLPSKPTSLTVLYQGCSLKGVCYPPQKTQIRIQRASPSSTGFILELFSFLGIGILMAFTPCVLPMLPIMTRIVVGHVTKQTSWQTFGLAFAYVIGMASSYALVGGVIAMIGKNLFILMQQQWIMFVLAAVFIYFGLATLGILDIKLPGRFQQKTLEYRASLSPGRYLTALVMGGISLLVLSPCVTAPLLGALTYITQMGQFWKGSLALFMLGIGMGIPLMIFVVSAGHWLPKAGSWMDNIKQFLALLLFGIATLLISRTLKAPYETLIWLAPLAITLFFFKPKAIHHSFSLLIRVILTTSIAIYMVLLALGTQKSKYLPWPFKGHYQSHGHRVAKSQQELDLLLSHSRNQPVMLYFSAKWCTSCQYLEHKVWDNPALSTLFKKVKFIKIDLSDNLPEQNQLMQHYQVIAPPTVILLDSKQKSVSCRLLGEEISISELKHWGKIVSKSWNINTCK